MADASFFQEVVQPCRHCGSHLFMPVTLGLCESCLKARTQARRLWAEELGVPAPAEAEFLELNAGTLHDQFVGWIVEMLGIRAASPSWPPPWPFWRIGPFVQQVWGRRIHCPGSPAFLEARWHPEKGEETVLRGLAGARIGDAQRALQGLRLLPYTDLRGRPPHSGTFKSPEEFELAVITAICSLRKAGRPITQEEVASLLPRSLRTSSVASNPVTARQLRQWCQSFGIPWDELKQRS